VVNSLGFEDIVKQERVGIAAKKLANEF